MQYVKGVAFFIWKHRRAIGVIVGSVLTITGYDELGKQVVGGSSSL